MQNKTPCRISIQQGAQKAIQTAFRFFHPDYTVGPGITPGQRLLAQPVAGLRHNAAHRRWGIAPRPETDFLLKIIAQVLQNARGCAIIRAIPHNSKCRYGERGAAAAKPKAQIILDVLSSILATQMPCRTPSRSEALRSATAACGGSWRGDPPERCLSRQAGIVRCCLR